MMEEPGSIGGGYVPVDIESVSVSQMGFLVFLRREGDREKVLPISIGPMEANAIAVAKQGKCFERPQTHDLLKSRP